MGQALHAGALEARICLLTTDGVPWRRHPSPRGLAPQGAKAQHGSKQAEFSRAFRAF